MPTRTTKALAGIKAGLEAKRDRLRADVDELNHQIERLGVAIDALQDGDESPSPEGGN